ncbi:MAG: hypothetical protein IK019_04440, partial [Clostridia bacterium]|nr:hypothetical protein [Clostridia bacterium]
VEAVKAEGGDRDVSFTNARVDKPNVMIETVKAALHCEGTIIRLCECFGARTKATLTLENAPEAACFTSLMEDDLEKAEFNGSSVELEFKPYEIVTLRIKK